MIISNEIVMESRSSLVRTTLEKLLSDSELRSRLNERELAFRIAVSEALANAVTHGNRNHPSKKVYIRYSYGPNDAVSVLVRDEGHGFDPENVSTPADAGEDRNRGICLMKSCMDEIQFRNGGKEVFMRMNGRARPPGK
jgi:anti-sigma regulatory factor (Ser/Thr protein kinase)